MMQTEIGQRGLLKLIRCFLILKLTYNKYFYKITLVNIVT